VKTEDLERLLPGQLTPIAQLPKVEMWLSELAALDLGPEGAAMRAERLSDMVRIVKAAGGCASLQTANGLPCRRSPRAGYPVCRKHGERAPQTVAKAERLLAIARMPAIEVLIDELDQAQEHECPTCGYPARNLKYRKHIAAISFKLLDRTGFGPRSSIDLTAKAVDEHHIDVSQLTDAEFEELSQLLEALDVFKGKIDARQARNVLAPAPTGALPLVIQATGVVEGQETKG
jgi:hypothetical protein